MQPASGPEIADLAWNNKVQHILATCTAAGTAVVWDLKKQRPVITLRDATRCVCENVCCTRLERVASLVVFLVVVVTRMQRASAAYQHGVVHSQRRGSSVAWNPEVATQLLVASEDDATPSLQLWDLRYSMAPVKELHGHTKARGTVVWC